MQRLKNDNQETDARFPHLTTKLISQIILNLPYRDVIFLYLIVRQCFSLRLGGGDEHFKFMHNCSLFACPWKYFTRARAHTGHRRDVWRCTRNLLVGLYTTAATWQHCIVCVCQEKMTHKPTSHMLTIHNSRPWRLCELLVYAKIQRTRNKLYII